MCLRFDTGLSLDGGLRLGNGPWLKVSDPCDLPASPKFALFHSLVHISAWIDSKRLWMPQVGGAPLQRLCPPRLGHGGGAGPPAPAGRFPWPGRTAVSGAQGMAET